MQLSAKTSFQEQGGAGRSDSGAGEEKTDEANQIEEKKLPIYEETVKLSKNDTVIVNTSILIISKTKISTKQKNNCIYGVQSLYYYTKTKTYLCASFLLMHAPHHCDLSSGKRLLH